MHFKDDPISDMHAKNYLIILCLKHFPGPTKFGPVFWSRFFRRGPVEYNFALYTHPATLIGICSVLVDLHRLFFGAPPHQRRKRLG